jgi:hypothetical protein
MTEGDLLTCRRAWSATALASRMAWKWSPTTVACRAARSARWRTAPRVQRGRADLGQPVARPGLKPAVHGGPGAVGHQVQQPAALQVDQTGPSGLSEESSSRPSRRPLPPPDEQRRPPAGCRGPHRPHRPQHGRPANAEVTSDRGHRVGVLADPPPGLSAGSLGQRRPGTDRGRPPAQVPTPQAGSRQRQIRLRQTAPPDSRHWAGRVPGPCAGRGARPAPLGPEVDRGGRGLDDEPPSPPATTGGEDLKPSKPSSLEADALLC